MKIQWAITFVLLCITIFLGIKCYNYRARAIVLEEFPHDWARLNYYREANRHLPSVEPNRVVFIGDSITAAWDLNKYFPDQPYINRGVGAQTSQQVLARFLPDVIKLKPKTVVIMVGINDIYFGYNMEQTQENFASMVEMARCKGINVILSSVLPVTLEQSERMPLSSILALNNWIKKYAGDNDLVYLDYFAQMADEKGFLQADLTVDGLHLNENGYQRMKQAAQQAIE